MITTWLRRADQPITRWKNDGGATRQLAIHPPGASLTDFEWRLSVAQIEVDGPFSTFPGIDRSLMLLSGSGVKLIQPTETTILTRPGESHDFRGEVPVRGELVQGPTEDLNLMLRRGRVRGALDVVRDGRHDGWLVALDGRPRVDGADALPGDAVFGHAMQTSGPGRWVSVRVRPA